MSYTGDKTFIREVPNDADDHYNKKIYKKTIIAKDILKDQ